MIFQFVKVCFKTNSSLLMGVNILYCVKGYDVFLHGKLLQLVDECNLVIATNMHR